MIAPAPLLDAALPIELVPSTPANAGAVERASPADRLRVALLLDSPLQPRWLVQVFADAVASGTIDVVAIAEASAAPCALPWLWRLYDHLDRRLFCDGPDLLARVDLKRAVPHSCVVVPAAELEGESTGASRWRADLAELRLDMVIVLGESQPPWLEGLARYGVWRYAFGEAYQPVDRLAGWQEVSEGLPVTSASLVVRTKAGDERVAYQTWSRTFSFSAARNRQQLLRKMKHVASRAMEQLRRDGETWLDTCPPLGKKARELPAPGAAQVLSTAAGVSRRIVRRAAEKALNVDQWFLAYRFQRHDDWDGSLTGFARLMPPKDRFWADPFPIECNGRHYIFFEELPFSTRKGHISVIEVTRDGRCSPARKVLERDYHLSYPFLIELQGELFMVPETLQNRTVECYRCVRFPDEWKLERLLLRDARCADATVHFQDGRWWMFVNIGIEGTEVYDELHLFWADRFEGPWKPHRGNPVKSDVRGARPGGRLFARDGRLYRPAQICAPLYGSGLCINEVLQLSTHAFLEQEHRRILPAGERLLGLHTWNRAGELCVIDAFTRRARLDRRTPADPGSLPLTHYTVHNR